MKKIILLVSLSFALICGGCQSQEVLKDVAGKIAGAESAVDEETKEELKKLREELEEAKTLIEEKSKEFESDTAAKDSGAEQLAEEVKEKVENSDIAKELEEFTKQLGEKDAIIEQLKSELENSKLNVLQSGKIDRTNENEDYASVEDLLFWLVIRFDNAWVKHINSGDREVFEYLKDGSALYEQTKNYKESHSEAKQKMGSISLVGVSVNGSQGYVTVHETLEEYSGGTWSDKEYLWKYSAELINGIWYLTEMKKA